MSALTQRAMQRAFSRAKIVLFRPMSAPVIGLDFVIIRTNIQNVEDLNMDPMFELSLL